MSTKSWKWLTRWLTKAVSAKGETDDGEEESLARFADRFNAAWVMRQLPLGALVVAYCMAVTTLHYQTQQDAMEKKDLKDSIADVTFRSITVKSELTEKTRQSIIERRLRLQGDSTLTVDPDGAIVIRRLGD